MEQQQITLDTAKDGRDFLSCIFKDGIGSLGRLYSDMQLQARCKQALGRQKRFDAEQDAEGFIAFIGLEKSVWENEPNTIYLCIYLWDSAQNQGDWWRGSLSQDYMTGNNAARRYIDGTLAQLAKIGWTGGDNWGAFAQQFINKKIPFWVSENTSKRDPSKKFYKIASLGESSVKVGECLAMPGFGAAQAPVQASAPAQAPVGGFAPAAPAQGYQMPLDAQAQAQAFQQQAQTFPQQAQAFQQAQQAYQQAMPPAYQQQNAASAFM